MFLRQFLHSFMIRILLIAVLISVSAAAGATVDFNDACRKAYIKTMELDFEAAKTIITAEKKKDPANLVPLFIENYAAFLKIVINEEKQNYRSFIEQAEDLADRFENEKRNNPYINYCATDLYLQMTFINTLDDSYFSAAMKIRKARSLILKNDELYPDFIPNKKALGMMNVALGSVPKSYGWILDILGLEGSVTGGLQMLKSLSVTAMSDSSFSWLSTEALLSYTFAAMNFGDSRADAFLDKTFKELSAAGTIERNQLMCYSATSYYRHNGENEKVIKLLKSRKIGERIQRFYYLDYVLGLASLYKMDPSTVDFFTFYLKKFPGENYRKSALQHIAWFKLITGDRAGYQAYMEMVKTAGAIMFDSDKQAMKAAESGVVPNKYLLKCRLLFDGGYYTEAARVFKLNNPKVVLKTGKDILEYNYRMGRIYDKSGNAAGMIKYYQKTIELGREKPYYFAANAALHLGYYFENQKNYDKAKTYYRLCLDMDYDEYRNSITQKAKAGLNRIKNK